MQINAKDYPTLSEELLNALAEILNVSRESVERHFIIPLLTEFCKSLKQGHKLFNEFAGMALLDLPTSDFDILKELEQIEKDLLGTDEVMKLTAKGVIFISVDMTVLTMKTDALT